MRPETARDHELDRRTDVENGTPWTRILAVVVLTMAILGGAAGLPSAHAADETGGPVADFQPADLSFGNQPVGTTGPSRGMTLYNRGDAPLGISGLALIGPNSQDFRIVSSGCGGFVAPGSSCGIAVTFTPLAGGSRVAALSISYNGTGSPHTASLTGFGVSPAVTLTTTTVDFGDQVVNSVSASRAVTLTNSGDSTLNFSGLSMAGAHPTDFRIGISNCGGPLAAGASCSMSLAFAPKATGPRSADFVIRTNAPGSPHTVALSGVGLAPPVSADPASVSFGDQPVGTTGDARTVTLTNHGTTAVSGWSFSPTGAHPGDFRLRSSTCIGNVEVPPGASCTFSVGFTPSAAGPRSAELRIHYNAPGSPSTIALSGNGIAPAVALSSSSLSFGDQPVAMASAPQLLNLTNSGTAVLEVSEVKVAGAQPEDFTTESSCNGSLAPGGSCTVAVTFTPTATGSRSADLTITDNAPGSPHTVALSGNGTPPPAPSVTLDPTSVSFGNQSVGTTSMSQTVTVTNSGHAPLAVSTVALEGPNPQDFRIGSDSCSDTSVVPGTSCAISLTFVPATTGPRAAALTITDNAAGSPRSVSLTGSGTPPPHPVVVLNPTTVAFGDQAVGTASGSRTVTVTNGGGSMLSMSSPSLGGAHFGDFQVRSSTCGPSLSPGASCSISLGFAPRAAGTRSAVLVLQDNAPGSPHTVPLSGNGLAPAIGFNPAALGFSGQAVGTASGPETVTVTNTGSATLSVGGLTLVGANPGDFQVRSDGCSIQGGIAPGSSCTISVGFAPTTTGDRRADLRVLSNAPGSPHTVLLTGTGMAPAVNLDPPVLNFGDQVVSTPSGPQTVTITNHGNAVLAVSAVGLAGAHPDDFTAQSSCDGAVAPGASCTVSVTFAPAATGPRSAVLTITDNAPGSPHSVGLSGTGTPAPAPSVSLSPASLSFGDQPVGTTSTPQPASIANSGNAALEVSAVEITGAHPGDFAADGSCNGAVAPATSCTVSVTFAPTATGARSAVLTISDNAAGSPHTVALSGTGKVEADLGVSIGATPNPVKNGNTLTYTVSLNNHGPSSATGVVLTVTPPAESQFVSSTAGSCRTPAPGATGTLTCNLGTVPVGSTSMQVVVKVVAPGRTSVAATAAVASTSGDANSANNSATVKTAVFGRK